MPHYMWVKELLWLLNVRLLGTPSIYVSTLAGTMGNFSELEEKYGLLFNYNDSEAALAKALELLKDPELKKSWGSQKGCSSQG